MQTASDGNTVQEILLQKQLRNHPDRREYDIRPADTPFQYGATSLLVRQMYERRGYDHQSIDAQLNDLHRITLATWQGGEVVATLTLRRDSPDGLLADVLYAQELKRLRSPARVLCEVTRLAIKPEFSSRNLLTALFQAAMQYGKDIFGVSDAVIEVNPRHAPYYRHQYGFLQIGALRQCPRVGAPAVLLHQGVDVISSKLGAPPRKIRGGSDPLLPG